MKIKVTNNPPKDTLDVLIDYMKKHKPSWANYIFMLDDGQWYYSECEPEKDPIGYIENHNGKSEPVHFNKTICLKTMFNITGKAKI